MIKFAAKMPNGNTFIGLGLEAKNMELLRAGKPIIVHGTELGAPVEIAIFFGETKEQMMEMLLGAGVELPAAATPQGSA